jgi:hypothetical protein
VPYQSAAGTTVQLAAGTSGYVLKSNGAAAPSWTAATISGVQLGSNLATLTMGVSGTGLSGSTTYNGSGAATFTVTSNATSANTASTIVARDASGNFSAGTITASLSGNATTATTAANVNNGTLTMNVSGTGLSGSQTFTANQSSAATFTVTSNATSANTASTIVARDASGNFSAGTITATLNGNASTATTAANVNNGTLTMNVSGTGLSGSQTFTANQAGAATFTVTSNATATAGAASTIVARDASGYIFNTYFNSTDNSVASGVSGVMVKAGDSYLRTGTAAAVATFISGQSMNIAGSATTFTSTSQNSQFNSIGVGTAASGTAGEIRATASVVAFYSSDIKFKENVRDIPNAAATAAAIGGKLFDWKDNYIEDHGGEDGYFVVKSDFGVIAQDVLAKFPVAVRTRPDGSLAVDYEKLSALALAANAEHEARISKLEALVAKLIEG